jgi:hypothetical protein
MNHLKEPLLFVATGALLCMVAYFMLDALMTRNPVRRRRDEQDLRIIGEAAGALQPIVEF